MTEEREPYKVNEPNRFDLTPGEIKANLHELANIDMWEVIVLLEEIRRLTSQLTVSQRGRDAYEKTEQALHLLGNIQSYLQNYPIVVTKVPGQPVG